MSTKLSRWTSVEWVVVCGPSDTFSPSQVFCENMDAEKAIDKAKAWAERNPGREVAVYQRAARLMAEVGPVEQIDG